MDDDERASLLQDEERERIEESSETKRPSPYAICIPAFFSVLTAAMVLGIQQQWLLLHLCSTFVKPDGTTIPELTTEYLPGFLNSHGILQSKPDWAICRSLPDIQAVASRYGMVLNIVVALPALLVGPFMGIYSDMHGRKPIFLLSMMSTWLFYLAYLSISKFNFGMWLLIFTGVISGFTGSYFGMLNATMSYFADTTDRNTRAKVFVIGESFFFAGFSIGPLFGGYLARHLENGADDVFLIALVSKLVVFVLTAMFLQESLVKKVSSVPETESKTVDVLEKIFDVFKIAGSATFILILTASLFTSAASTGTRTIFFYYVSYTFGWDAQDEGQYLLVLCVSRLFYMLALYPVLSKIFESTIANPLGKVKFDLSIIRIGVFISATCAVLQALAPKGEYLYIITMIDGFQTLAGPTIASILSGAAPSSSQGLLFSGITLMNQVFSILSGILFPIIWASTVKSVPNSFFFVVSSFYLISFGIYVIAVKPDLVLRMKIAEEREVYDDEEEILIEE